MSVGIRGGIQGGSLHYHPSAEKLTKTLTPQQTVHMDNNPAPAVPCDFITLSLYFFPLIINNTLIIN